MMSILALASVVVVALLLLGAALLWVTFAWGVREAYSAQWLLLTFIVFAGVVGTITMRNRGILVFQSLPALAALLFIWANTPDRERTGRGPAGDVQASAQTWPILE